MACALARAPSSEGPVEAPVRTPIWNSWPASCAALARSAIASGIALGAPAGVNPLNPTVCPWSMREAASSGVRTGNGRDMEILVLLGMKNRQQFAAGRERRHLPGFYRLLQSASRLATAALLRNDLPAPERSARSSTPGPGGFGVRPDGHFAPNAPDAPGPSARSRRCLRR